MVDHDGNQQRKAKLAISMIDEALRPLQYRLGRHVKLPS
jgi:hypothetical protein